MLSPGRGSVRSPGVDVLLLLDTGIDIVLGPD